MVVISHEYALDHEVLWRKLFDADKKNYVIATTVQSRAVHKSKKQVESTGLLDSHAYSLIALYDLTIGAKKEPLRLIKIRNPWG